MGSCFFEVDAEAATGLLAYEKLVDEAREEFGDDPYNGTISTTIGCREDTAHFYTISDYGRKKYSEAIRKKAHKKLEDIYENVNKRECRYADLGICRYEVYRWRYKPIISNPRYVLGYVVTDGSTPLPHVYSSKMDARAAAVKYFGERLEKSGVEHDVRVEKRYVLMPPQDSSAAIVGRMDSEMKVCASAPKRMSGEGMYVVPIHHYLFYGWAAE
jgi:hypothetical protein